MVTITPLHDGATDGTAERQRDDALHATCPGLQTAVFLRRCAQSLELDTAVTATALMLLHRFFDACAPSLRSMDAHVFAGACVFIATKSCEVPRSLRSVVNVVHAVANDSSEPLSADAPYTNLKNSLINAEQTVLRGLRFDVDVTLPHRYLFHYAHAIDADATVTRCALALVNDALLAPKAVAFPPFVLAAACLRLAQAVEDGSTQEDSKWWYRFDTSDDDIEAVAQLLQQTYGSISTIAPSPNS